MSVHSLNVKTGAETALAQQFAALPPSEPRRAAFAAFERSGLPTRRDEAWHYTDLRAKLTETAPLAPAPDAARLEAAAAALTALPRLGGTRLALVDGRWAAALCDPPPGGLTAVPTSDAPEPDEAIVALNVAFTEGALRIGLPPGESALEIVHLDGPGAIFSRLEVFVPARAHATIVERFEGASGATQRNAMAILGLGESARCDWTTLVCDDAALHLETRRARLAGDAALHDFGFVCGGALVRRQIDACHQTPGASIALSGLSLLDGTRHADTTLTVRHTAPRGVSREYFRHIVADAASGVYQGKVVVSPHAQKTDGAMKSQALLLSPTAQMSNKPELEIFADDVVCGHGATVGALDPQQQIFYLRSRGIPEREAEAMLLEAFGAEAIERVADAGVAEALRERLSLWLKGEGVVTYDVERLRADFPILAERPYGKPLIYLDNAASAQKPKAVLDRLTHFYEHEYSNVHRGLHYLANAATDAYEAARESVRRYLNAKSIEEIVFARSATEAINLVASSYGLNHIGEGDEIVLSIMEHHANIVPWHFLRERKGAVLKWVDVADDGSISAESFAEAIGPRTKFVAVSAMSNVLGTVAPVKEIIRLAHQRGVPVLVDASQAAVHGNVDVRALDVDFLVVTGHKLYGPTGIGALYGKAERLAELPPFNGGGEMIEEVTMENVTYNAPPHRFEAGTPPIAQAVGFGAALDYIESVGREAIAAHEAGLTAYAHERLGAINSLRIIGDAPGKGPILSFTMEGAHAHDIATLIDRSGVAVRAGTHCAMPLLKRFGVTSTCRASFALYNTRAEVDALAEALVKAHKLFE